VQNFRAKPDTLFAGRPEPAALDVARTAAVARLILGGSVNLQVPPNPSHDANDFGGTLMNESISTSAGAPHGQFLHPAEMRSWIRGAGRTPVQRSTTYQILRIFDEEPAEPEASWDAARFGSYATLIASPEFRFRDRS
jgi:2-iminoacetate synthase ThiH